MKTSQHGYLHTYHFFIGRQWAIYWDWKILSNIPANIRLDEDVFRLCLQRTSSRRLQDVMIKTNIVALLIRLQNTSSRLLQNVLIKTNIFVLAIRLQAVFKTSSRRLAKRTSRHLQDVFETFWRHLQDVFKMSSRHLQDVLPRRLQDAL